MENITKKLRDPKIIIDDIKTDFSEGIITHVGRKTYTEIFLVLWAIRNLAIRNLTT